MARSEVWVCMRSAGEISNLVQYNQNKSEWQGDCAAIEGVGLGQGMWQTGHESWQWSETAREHVPTGPISFK